MNKPEIYTQYNSLVPFIGDEYLSSEKRLLIIGESFYVTGEENKKKVSPDIWYAANYDEQEFHLNHSFNTKHVVDVFIDPKTPHRPHLNIFNNLNHALNNAIYNEDRGPERSTFEKVAFYNFFQRPAIDGKSIKFDDKDVEVATEVLKYNLHDLKPDLVILASSLVSRIAFSIVRDFSPKVKHISIPHPASAWWNRKVSWLNGMRTKDFVIQFLIDNEWK